MVGALAVDLEVVVGAVAEELGTAGTEVGEPSNELLSRRRGRLVEPNRGHASPFSDLYSRRSRGTKATGLVTNPAATERAGALLLTSLGLGLLLRFLRPLVGVRIQGIEPLVGADEQFPRLVVMLPA